jgi:hypothetical protein
LVGISIHLQKSDSSIDCVTAYAAPSYISGFGEKIIRGDSSTFPPGRNSVQTIRTEQEEAPKPEY